MIRQYVLISAATIALMLAKKPEWNFASYETTYSWPDGRKVHVYERRLLDSLELTGWNDITVRYPISLNDSNAVHTVFLHDSEIVNQ